MRSRKPWWGVSLPLVRIFPVHRVPVGRACLVLVFALAVAACTGSANTTATDAPDDPPALTALTMPVITSTTSTTAALPAATTSPAHATTVSATPTLEAEVRDLIDVAEGIRGLGFIVPPQVVVLEKAEFDIRIGPLMDERLNDPTGEAMTLLFRLVGLLEEDEAVDVLRREHQGPPETAWYDASSGQLFVTGQQSGLGPLARSELVHEIVHALADQHYRWSDTRAGLVAAGADDRLAAFDALVEGDATYFQVVYVQSLSPAEREEIALAFVEPSPEASNAPAWLLRDLAFPFEDGFEFVADLVVGGGIAGVDRAYLDPPTASEHILHPERYRRGEIGPALNHPDLTIDGYTALPAASFGEWGLRLLFDGTMLPGLLTQTADGWGNDSYRMFVSGGDVAFALLYVGDAEAHTEEVTQAFIDFVEDELDLGDGEWRGGGQVYSLRNRPWVFLDREGNGLLVVIASDADVGGELADQLSPPE